MALVRLSLHLTPQQIERLKRMAKRDGRSMAEHARNAVDAYLDEGGWKEVKEVWAQEKTSPAE
jgi:hypothetical protein